jgi:Na+/pantothenate symporter
MSFDINSYRIAAAFLLVFCALHTIGGLLLSYDYGPPGNNVLASMKQVHFDFFGSDCSFYGFHMGFGFMVSVFLAVSAAITWTLGNPRARANPAVAREMRPIALALLVAYTVVTLLSWKYFFIGPFGFSVAITVLIGQGFLKSNLPR